MLLCWVFQTSSNVRKNQSLLLRHERGSAGITELMGWENTPAKGAESENLFSPGAGPLGAIYVWVPHQQCLGEKHLQEKQYGPTPLLDFTGPRLLQTQLQEGEAMQSLTQR